MNYQIRLAFAFLVLVLCQSYALAQEKQTKESQVVFLDHPAENWHQAFPIGNGSLGGMVYGGILSDTIKLNEETLWSGEPRDLQNYNAKKYLPRIRKLLLENKTDAGQALIDSVMLGEWNECYLPMGDLVIRTDDNTKVEEYRRELNLDKK